MAKQSAVNTLNYVRSIASPILQNAIPVATLDKDIRGIGEIFINNPIIKNEFIDVLINKVIQQKVERKVFNNKLKFLEGEKLPLGQIVEPSKRARF